MCFLREGWLRSAVEDACRAEGLEPAGWREVPTRTAALGVTALASLPRIEQLLLAPSDLHDAERRAYRARRRAERVPGVYVASLSFRTVTYKALCAAAQLARFYPDLEDPDLAVPFAIFHQRFSTNTEPSWERAQPFRLLCHNGEINTIDGNVTWTEARERRSRRRAGAGARTRSERVGLGAPRQRARAARARRRCRDRPGVVDARPARLAERPAPGRRGSRLPPLRRDAQRALGRTGGAVLHGRPDVRRGARPQRPSTTSRRRRRRRASCRLLRGRGGAVARRRPRAQDAVGTGRHPDARSRPRPAGRR